MAPEPKPSATSPRGIDSKERDHLAKLILSDRTGDAVDLAKDIHRRERSSESESLLLDAYGARLSTLAERNLTREAESMVATILERYPSAQARLPEWHARMSARRGNLDELLRELNGLAVSAERAAAIQAELRRDLHDPGQLADCAALPPDHPLRAGARAVRDALTAVTRGPVTGEQIALAGIPRSSPLAPWKMLVRAIDAFYRGDPALCERSLMAVDHDSPAARLAPALHAMMGKPRQLSPAAEDLVKEVSGGTAPLRAALERLDTAFGKKDHAHVFDEIKAAMTLCREVDQDLARILLQRISVRSMLAGLQPAKVTVAAGGMSIKDSRFWHLIARATERDRNDSRAMLTACAMWNQFVKHAVAEKRFDQRSPAVAAVFLHIAGTLERVEAHTLSIARRDFMRSFDGFAAYYRGQPAEIVKAGEFDGDFYFLNPASVLEEACAADACTANYERWFRTVQAEGSQRPTINAAERWAAALPEDIPAWLHLMLLAEERNALKLAFKYMERAEQLDGLNAEVRRARLRLLIRIAVKHVRDKKFKLCAADLDQIDALPQAKQGDRPALFLAFRHILANANNDAAGARECRRQAASLLGGEPAGQILTMQVESWCRSPHPGGPEQIMISAEFVAAFARVCALGEDLDAPFGFFVGTGAPIAQTIASAGFQPDPAHLAALGEVALRNGEQNVVHAATAKGLRLDPLHHGRFLFLRARNTMGWDFERVSSCIAAATELARRNHDLKMLAAIAAFRETRGGMLGPESATAMPDSAEIAKVIQREIDAPLYTPPPASRTDRDICQCSECRARRAAGLSPLDPDEGDDDFDGGFDDDEEDGSFDLPPGLERNLPRELIEMLQDLGPEKTAQILVEMMEMDRRGPGRGKGPGRPRKRK